MDVLRHKRFGYSSVYDKDLLRRDESGGFWGESGQHFGKSGGFWAKNGQFLFFYQSRLNAALYLCEKHLFYKIK